MDKTCLQCGRDFVSRKATRKFCSPECFHAASKNKIKEITCGYCGQKFMGYGDTKYCSHACSSLGLRKREERNCLVCGKSFITLASSKQKLCSKECAGITKRRPISKTCPTCNKIFNATRLDTIFCSVSCTHKSRTHADITKICPNCGKQFIVDTKHKKQKYCSQGCYNIQRFKALNRTCITCGTLLTFAKNAKYCSRECFYLDKQGNRKNIKPTLLKERPECFRCGFKELPGILQLHHKDRNRNHNSRKNTELLCPNCHETDHYEAQDGRYAHPTNGKEK